MDVNVELLIGTQVRDINGEKVGRIQELRVDRQDQSCLVESYLIGASALVERLSAWTLVRPIVRVLNARHLYRLYDVWWQDMDLSNPRRPKLKIASRDLRHVK
ncbi:MAG TPA: PRC-barrel domain-containing protein [Gemmatimonadaceae bacterium]|jgi:sporulation protein YlmC with PRC-barrel domain